MSSPSHTVLKTLLGAYSSIGIVYGDIATSPLYVLSAVFPSDSTPGYDEILGATSLLVWTLTIILLCKYTLLVLRADDEGEGGAFAMYNILWRSSGLAKLHNGEKSPVKDSYLRRNKWAQIGIVVILMISVGLLLGDGVLTPCVSILSAVEGLESVSSISHAGLMGIASALLIFVFAIQPFGTHKIAFAFSPVILLWLIAIFSIGIWNITKYPQIFAALSPHYAALYFKTGLPAWLSMGNILLCVTGAEALYADMGHFSRPAIQTATIGVVYPALIIAYLGQAAALMVDKSIVGDVFWGSIPDIAAIYWIVFVISILATIVASQALITASFSLISQAISLDFMPPLTIVHTSKDVREQIYIPEVNWTLMVLCLIVTLSFGASAALESAYGIAVAAAMLLTTMTFVFIMTITWAKPIWLAALFSGPLIIIEGAYLASALVKIPHGGWLPLVLAFCMMVIMSVWRFGHGITSRHTYDTLEPASEANSPSTASLEPVAKSTLSASPSVQSGSVRQRVSAGAAEPHDTKFKFPSHLKKDDENQATVRSMPAFMLQQTTARLDRPGYLDRVQGMSFFLTEEENEVPTVFYHFAHCFPSISDEVVFVSIQHINQARVDKADRVSASRLHISHEPLNLNHEFWNATIYLGYSEDLSGEYSSREIADLIVDRICRVEMAHLQGGKAETNKVIEGQNEDEPKVEGIAMKPTIEIPKRKHYQSVERIREAYKRNLTFISGRKTLRVSHSVDVNWAEKLLLRGLVWGYNVMQRNFSQNEVYFHTPHRQTLEVWMKVDAKSFH